MKPGIPWSIKGIESETREAAKAAARRSGMTLGQWLNGMIQETAEPPQLVTEPRKSNKSRKSAKKERSGKGKKGKKHARSDVDNRLSDLADQLSRMAETNQATAVSRFVDYDDYEQVEETLTALVERMERSDHANRESFTSINDRLDGFDDKLASVVGQDDADEIENEEYRALEKALRNIVEHIETSERKNRDVLDDMQNRISSMAKQAEETPVSQVQQNAPALAALEARISELGDKFDMAAKTSSTQARDYVDERLSGLGEQIDAMRHAGDGLVKRAEMTALETAKREAKVVEQRVADLIGEARTLMQSALPANADVSGMRDEIGSLNQRFDDIKSEAASDRELQSLKLAVEQLTTSVNNGFDTQPLTAMEQRLGEISQRLDEAPSVDHMAPQFAELDQRIYALDEKLVAAIQNQNDSSSFEALESHIATVGDRLSATEEKLGHLATIDQSISQLYTSIEENRSWAQQSAKNAAYEMAEKVMQNIPAPAPVDPAPSAELQALEQGLNAVKQSAEASEKHNQETLEAVHETLEQIITKLAVLEAQEQAPAPEPAAAPATVMGPDNAGGDWQAAVHSHLQDGVSAPVDQPDVVSPLSDSDASPAFNPGQVPDMAETATHDVQIPSLQPEQEPSSPVQPPAPDVALSDNTPVDPAKASPDTPAPMDYIAQARLASQSAAAQSSNPLAKGGFIAEKLSGSPSDENLQKAGKKSLFSLSFLKKNKQPGDDKSAIAPKAAANENTPNRKRLLLAGLILLIAAGSFAYSKFSKPAAKSASAPTVTQPEQKTPATTPPAKKTSARSHQTIYAKPVVNKVTMVKSEPVATKTALSGNQTVMPPSSALTAANKNVDPVLSAPSDPVTTSSLPPVPPSVNPSAVSSPLNIQRAVSKQPHAPSAAAVETGQKLPSKKVGSLELRKAAAAGDASAQFVIASRYINGKLVKRDYAKAALWFQKAASNGLAPAQYRLGTLFERGNGVPKDLNAARLWYERAAEKGNVKAMHNLAVIYAGAKTGQADFAKARKWFEKAASHGLQDSQFNLAVILERGLTGKSDMKQAFIWYSLAGARGDRDAGIKAHSLSNHLSAADRKDALAKIAAWKPQPPQRVGNFVAIKDPKWQVAAARKAPVTLPPKPNLAGKQLIKASQSLLSKLGFDVGSPDGVMGSRTGNAVRLFQLQNGLPVNGMVTNDLLQQLQART